MGGAGGLAVSLALIHIYVAPLKRMLQARVLMKGVGRAAQAVPQHCAQGVKQSQHQPHAPTLIPSVSQALLAVGVAGGGYLMLTQPQPLPEYVGAHPSAVWLVGPAFAALTGGAAALQAKRTRGPYRLPF